MWLSLRKIGLVPTLVGVSALAIISLVACVAFVTSMRLRSHVTANLERGAQAIAIELSEQSYPLAPTSAASLSKRFPDLLEVWVGNCARSLCSPDELRRIYGAGEPSLTVAALRSALASDALTSSLTSGTYLVIDAHPYRVTALAMDERAAEHRAMEALRPPSWALCGALVAALVFVGFALRVLVVRPLNRMTSHVRKLATLDTTERIDASLQGEMRALADVINSLGASLRGAVENLRAITDNVTGAVEHVGRAAQASIGCASAVEVVVAETARAVDSARTAIRSVEARADDVTKAADASRNTLVAGTAARVSLGVAVAALNSSVDDSGRVVADAADRQADISTRATQLATTTGASELAIHALVGTTDTIQSHARAHTVVTERLANEVATRGKIISKAILALDGIRERSGKLAAAVDGVQRRTTAIGEVGNIIDDIREQCSLLSVNAAIAAAKTGDAGFAALADDMKAVWNRVADAALEISSLVHAIQVDVTHAGAATSHWLRAVDVGVSLACEASSVVDILRDANDDAQRLTCALASATTAQAGALVEVRHASERVHDEIDHLGKALQHQRRGTDAVAASYLEMRALAHEVRQAMSIEGNGARQIATDALNLGDVVSALHRALREYALTSLYLEGAYAALRAACADEKRELGGIEEAIGVLRRETGELRDEVGRIRV